MGPMAPLVSPPRAVLGNPKLNPSVIQAAPTVYCSPPARKVGGASGKGGGVMA